MRLSKEDYFKKFKYELKYRKKEFNQLCMRKAITNNILAIKEHDFYSILKNFTSYLSEDEIIQLIDNTSKQGMIYFGEIMNYPCYEEELYTDEFLLIKNKNYSDNIKLKPHLEPLYKLSVKRGEENFLIKIAKAVSNKKFQDNINISDTDENLIKSLMNKYDLNKDGYFSIGELNNFLISCNINLGFYDLRFFFEIFNVNNKVYPGKVKNEEIVNLIVNYMNKTIFYNDDLGLYEDDNKKNITFTINSSNNIIEQEDFDKYLKDSYIFNVLEDSLKVLGKPFLINYFANHFEIMNDKSFIDFNWLEIGLKNLGYEEFSPVESGQFKIFCIKKGFVLNNQTSHSIKINLVDLFDYMINNFKLKASPLSQDKIANKIFSFYSNEISNLILDSCKDKEVNTKFLSQINEFDLRRSFINNFNFIDHQFMDNLILLLTTKSNDLKKSKVTSMEEINNKSKNTNFAINYINSQNIINLMFNFLFLGFIKNSDQLGLLLDESDKNLLKTIDTNISAKIFNTFDTETSNKQNSSSTSIIKSKENDQNVYNIVNPLENNKNDINLKDSKLKINICEVDKKQETKVIKEQKENNISLNENFKTTINTSETIPKLYNLSVSFLEKKYYLNQNINYDKLRKLGACSFLREMISNYLDTKQDDSIIYHYSNNTIELKMFLEICEFYKIPNDLIDFIKTFIFTSNKKNEGLLFDISFKDKIIKVIQLSSLFKEIENIILDYSKYKEI